MRPYWINRQGRLGAGITAYSEADALALFAAAFGADEAPGPLRPILDAAELDQGHVIPNMGNMLKRGIWFPLGYDHISN